LISGTNCSPSPSGNEYRAAAHPGRSLSKDHAQLRKCWHADDLEIGSAPSTNANASVKTW